MVNLFLVSGYFVPTSSAAINTKANKKPPLPSFQERTKESGYARSVNKIGEISIKIAAIVVLTPSMVSPTLSLERKLSSPTKLHTFFASVTIKAF